MRSANEVGGSFFEQEQKPVKSLSVVKLSKATVCAVVEGINEALHRGNLGVLLRFPGARWGVFIFVPLVLPRRPRAAFLDEALTNQREPRGETAFAFIIW